MIPGLSSIGGSVLSGSAGADPVSSRSGDISERINNPFAYDASFQVGGSGSQSLSNGKQTNPSDKTALYIVSGLFGAALLAFTVYAIRRK